MVVIVTMADPTGAIPAAGLWLRDHRVPSAVIFVIFLLSGLMLDAPQLRAGLREVKGTLAGDRRVGVVIPSRWVR